MLFSFEPQRISKELLLSKHSEEEYMSFYLGIIPDDEMHINPLRLDHHPTATFYRAKNNELVFKDWSTGMHLNFIDLVIYKYKVTFVVALDIIANDFGIINKNTLIRNQPLIEYKGSKVENKAETFIQVELKDYSSEELLWWREFGISHRTLIRYHVYALKNVFINGSHAHSFNSNNPIYGYYFGNEKTRELWKIYFPKKKAYRFLLNTNTLQGELQLPENGDYVVVTKSMKDVMVLYEMGIAAVAPQAESVIISEEQYIALKQRFKLVIFNGDWDKAGQRFMYESRRRYPSICLSFVDKLKYAKDISDYAKKVGFEKAKELVDFLKVEIENGLLNYQLRYCN